MHVLLIYVDLHADLNTPQSVPDGALDWMGMAHMLGEKQATDELSAAASAIRYPTLLGHHGSNGAQGRLT